MENQKIQQGQIWQVKTDTFFTTKDDKKNIRSVNLNRGEFIEIRYASEWHFRTKDNLYFHAKPQMILDNCYLFGVIWENVRFSNIAKLEDILRLVLYTHSKPSYERYLENYQKSQEL